MPDERCSVHTGLGFTFSNGSNSAFQPNRFRRRALCVGLAWSQARQARGKPEESQLPEVLVRGGLPSVGGGDRSAGRVRGASVTERVRPCSVNDLISAAGR